MTGHIGTVYFYDPIAGGWALTAPVVYLGQIGGIWANGHNDGDVAANFKMEAVVKDPDGVEITASLMTTEEQEVAVDGYKSWGFTWLCEKLGTYTVSSLALSEETA